MIWHKENWLYRRFGLTGMGGPNNIYFLHEGPSTCLVMGHMGWVTYGIMHDCPQVTAEPLWRRLEGRCKVAGLHKAQHTHASLLDVHRQIHFVDSLNVASEFRMIRLPQGLQIVGRATHPFLCGQRKHPFLTVSERAIRHLHAMRALGGL